MNSLKDTNKLHKTIFLQIKDEYGEDQEEVSWCDTRQLDGDLEYSLSRPMPIADAPKDERILLHDCEGWIFGKWNPFKADWETDHGELMDATHWLPEPPDPK